MREMRPTRHRWEYIKKGRHIGKVVCSRCGVLKARIRMVGRTNKTCLVKAVPHQ